MRSSQFILVVANNVITSRNRKFRFIHLKWRSVDSNLELNAVVNLFRRIRVLKSTQYYRIITKMFQTKANSGLKILLFFVKLFAIITSINTI